MPLINSEPTAGILEHQTRALFFGAFVAYLFLFVQALRNRGYPLITLLLLPALTSTISHFALSRVPLFEEFLQSTTALLDFPASFIEAVLTIRLFCFISRLCLNQLGTPASSRRLGVLPSRTADPYRAVTTILSIATASVGFVFLLYGSQWAHISYLKIYLAIAVLLLLLAVGSTLICDNGLISDLCLVFLRTSLSLAPVISYASGDFSWWLRSLCVIASFLTLPVDLAGTGPITRLPAIGVVLQGLRRSRGEPRFKRELAAYSLSCALLAYFLLSPNAFLRPHPRICGWQAVVVPGVYLVMVLNEAGYFHVVTSPR
jgi:hypothetical protein